MKKLTQFALASLIAAPTAFAAPKNIIFMIGDGMGPAYITAYRHFKDNPQTHIVEPTIFDKLLVGKASTHPHHQSGIVTDSAAAATALSTSTKTYNGAIALDVEKAPLTTLFEVAKGKKALGIAVTSAITHATPASFIAHNESRKNTAEILEDMSNNPADVMFGAASDFTDKQIDKLTKQGYAIVDNYQAIQDNPSDKIIGNLPIGFAIDDANRTRLSVTTQVALNKLQNRDEGFILLVEGSRIDWGGHSNDIVDAMYEMDDFASAIKVAYQFTQQRDDTLLVITADHSTGGLTLSRDGAYRWDSSIIKNAKSSTTKLASSLLAKNKFDPTLVEANYQIQLSNDESNTLNLAHQQGEKALIKALRALVDLRSGTGWTTTGHTAVDVNVYATGQGFEQFLGHQDNTDIGKKLINFIK